MQIAGGDVLFRDNSAQAFFVMVENKSKMNMRQYHNIYIIIYITFYYCAIVNLISLSNRITIYNNII